MVDNVDTRPSFNQLLQKKWGEGKFVCVGLDPDFDKLPDNPFHKHDINDRHDGWMLRQLLFEQFTKPIIDATADTVCAYKPNLAFFEFFEHGHTVLSQTVNYIQEKYPDIAVIGDGKRADIGNTNKGYARMAYDPSLGRYGFDAMTTNPYLGGDTFGPFLSYDNNKDVKRDCKGLKFDKIFVPYSAKRGGLGKTELLITN